MEWHFGQNCANYLPSLNKCRILIDMRSQRAELTEDKWLDPRDILVYMGCSADDLIDSVQTGKVGVKRLKNGRLLFRVSAAWEWDDCPLGDAGGQCMYFEPHGGQRISCLKDLERDHTQHPNVELIPSDDAIRRIEDHFTFVRAGQSVLSF